MILGISHTSQNLKDRASAKKSRLLLLDRSAVTYNREHEQIFEL